MSNSDCSEGTADRDEFAQRLLEAIREAGEPAQLAYDRDAFTLSKVGGPSHVLYLGNAFAEYRATSPEGREMAFRRVVRSWFANRKELPDVFGDALPDLLPTVRSRSLFELTPLRLRAEGRGELDTWPYRILGGHLGVGIVYDLPESMTQLQQKTLAGWGVSFDDALSAACENLRGLSAGEFVQAAPGVWRSPWRDNYDAARLALPEVLQRWEVKGDLVAAVPHRDVLLLTGSEDEAGLAVLVGLIEEHMEGPRPLSAVPVVYDGKTWLPFLPDRQSPVYERLRLLQLRSAVREYEDQKECLSTLYEQTSEDIFVASFTAVRRGQEVLSYCVWSEGVDALLPRTDEIVFFQPTEDGQGRVLARGTWDRVRAVVGELMEKCDLYPLRFRVDEFPTEEELAKIGVDEG
jgi:Protein of unknown function (DUF1444)